MTENLATGKEEARAVLSSTPPSHGPTAAPGIAIREDSPAEDLIKWSLQRFAGQRLILTTSFGMEGCALIDLYGRLEKPLDVIYVDTGLFFPATYELRDRLEARYPQLRFVRKTTSLAPEDQTVLHGPELWKRDPDLCCKIRKVEPMADALRDADVWVTAIRRGQSATRASIRTVDWDWKFQVVKICPLASWTRQQVWRHIQANGVPFNPLHLKGYPSIGCTHCTSPVPCTDPDGYSREGRWNGLGKTECGLHGDGI